MAPSLLTCDCTWSGVVPGSTWIIYSLGTYRSLPPWVPAKATPAIQTIAARAISTPRSTLLCGFPARGFIPLSSLVIQAETNSESDKPSYRPNVLLMHGPGLGHPGPLDKQLRPNPPGDGLLAPRTPITSGLQIRTCSRYGRPGGAPTIVNRLSSPTTQAGLVSAWCRQ